MVMEMADTSGLKVIGPVFAILTLAVTATTAAVVANVNVELLDPQLPARAE